MISETTLRDWFVEYRSSSDFEPPSDDFVVAYVVDSFMENKGDALFEAMPIIFTKLAYFERGHKELSNDLKLVNLYTHKMNNAIGESSGIGPEAMNTAAGLSMAGGLVGVTVYRLFMHMIITWTKDNFSYVRRIANQSFGAAA